MVALLCLAQFVVVLDATIVAIALPAIQHDFAMSTPALGWVVTAYTLVFGGSLLAAGRVADRYGRRRCFAAGLALFAAASLACGLAPGATVLVAARATQGVGAALVMPSALALLTELRPGPRAMRWWTAAAAGGGAGGWVLGGVISGALGWRWIYLVNVPVCLAALLLVPRVLPERRGPAGPLDLPGAALATTGLGAVVLTLTLVHDAGPGAAPTLGTLAAAAVLLGALAAWERRAAAPLLDPSLLRRPGVAEPNLVALTLTAVTTAPMFLAVLYAQHVLGLRPVTAGLLFAPFNLAVIAGSLAGPRGRRAMAGGLLAIAAGGVALLLARSPGALVAGFLVMGSGLGAASVVSTTRGTSAAGRDHQGLASGLLGASAQIGTALGLAVVLPVAAAGGRAVGFAVAAGIAALAGATVLARGDRRADRRKFAPRCRMAVAGDDHHASCPRRATATRGTP
jgi:MFS family permease